jgi:hypothetical protein
VVIRWGDPENIAAVRALIILRNCAVDRTGRNYNDAAAAERRVLSVDLHFDLPGDRKIEFIIAVFVHGYALKMRIIVIIDFKVIPDHFLSAGKFRSEFLFHENILSQFSNCFMMDREEYSILIVRDVLLSLTDVLLIIGLIVTLQEAVYPPLTVVAVMYTVPGLIPVMLPFESTVAILVLLEVHLTLLSVASAGDTVALRAPDIVT